MKVLSSSSKGTLFLLLTVATLAASSRGERGLKRRRLTTRQLQYVDSAGDIPVPPVITGGETGSLLPGDDVFGEKGGTLVPLDDGGKAGTLPPIVLPPILLPPPIDVGGKAGTLVPIYEGGKAGVLPPPQLVGKSGAGEDGGKAGKGASKAPTISPAPTITARPSPSPSISSSPTMTFSPSKAPKTKAPIVPKTPPPGATLPPVAGGQQPQGSGSGSVPSRPTDGSAPSPPTMAAPSPPAVTAPSLPTDGGGAPIQNAATPTPPTPSPFEGFPPIFTSGRSDLDCAGIAAGTATKADNRIAYVVDFDLVVDSDFSFDVVADAVRQILQQKVAPLAAGCVGRRRMQETSSTGITNIIFFAPEQSTTATCTADSLDNTCYATDVDAFIYYTGGNTDDHRDRLLAAFEQSKVDGLFAGIPGFVDINGIDVAKGGTAVAAATGQTNGGDDGISGGAIAAVAIAGAGLVLLLLLLARRRKSSETRAVGGYLHHADDDSCFLDGTSTVNSSEVPQAYNTRSVHVVGEEDSVISEWTGFNPHKGAETSLIMSDLMAMENNGNNGGVRGAYGASTLNPENCDVHNCTSSLCEACERSRQRGPFFIPIGEPIPAGERLPANATRIYGANDTVDL